MASKPVNFTYYRSLIFPQNELFDLSSTFEHISNLTPQHRVQRYFGDLIQLASVQQEQIGNHNIWKLRFCRYRNGIVPESGNPITTDFAPINLPPGFQLAEVLSAIYDPELNLIYTQQNRSAVNEKAIASYLTAFLIFEEPELEDAVPQQLSLELLINPNAFEDIQRLGSIKSFSAIISNPHDPEIQRAAQGTGLGPAIDSASFFTDEYELTVSYEVKIKRRNYNSSISPESVINTIRPFVDIADTNNNVKSIIVKGCEEEGEKNLPINLLKYKIYDTNDFQVERGQAISHENIETFMVRKYFERREFLRRILTNNH